MEQCRGSQMCEFFVVVEVSREGYDFKGAARSNITSIHLMSNNGCYIFNIGQ